MQLSRPLYESLPWLYALLGLAGIITGYALHGGWVCTLLSLAGFCALIAGVVVWLRRRSFRATRDDYIQRD